jgi:DNA-binding winged helix-turn-helix (wHTH) protein
MPHSNNLCYEFGPFKLNVAQRTLSRDGNVISLPPKATDILLVLLQNAGELVHKEDLMKEVWPDSFVEEGTLTQNIFTLRKALGDHRSGAQYIQTVVRCGYRFIAAVRVVENLEGTADRNLDVEPRPITTLAVFPIRNVTGDDGLQYLAEGVTDSIINNLTEIPKLRVMSRSTVLRYRSEEIDPQVIANELHVDAMLLGKLVFTASRLFDQC